MTSPLGDDVLIPTSLSGHEAISQPFSYRVSMVSETGAIDPDAVLNKPGCVIVRRDEDVARYVNGVFHEFAATGMPRPDMYGYHAVLVPRLWFLSQTIDCRIYQEKTTVEILQQMFNDAGLTAVTFRINGEKLLRKYIVQFNETDLQFATRLMEESGYFYFFEHSADKHTLVIADNNTAFPESSAPPMRFDPMVQAEDALSHWHRPKRTTHGKVTLKDFDPTVPSRTLEKTVPTTLKTAGAATRDVFLWPAATRKTTVVDSRTNLMMEAAEAAVALVGGGGCNRAMIAGSRFDVAADPSGGPADTHVIRSLSMDVVDDSWSTGGGSAHCANSFEAFPASVPWRQPFSVPAPDMGGVHSGIVLGGDGDEIHTDDKGRVKVRFHWDHRNDATAELSVWARVVQPWAGHGWGGYFIPRVGSEVAVAFVDGDPDRPIVLGGLYNGDDMPFFAEAQKTKSGFRTKSTPNGGANDYNEFTFDDKKGSELVYLHGQKDHRIKIEHNETLVIGHDRSATIGHDETIDIGNAQTITIGHGRKTEITGQDDSLTVKQGDLIVEVAQGKMTVTAMQSIELRVGESVLRIDPNGITLDALTIGIKAQLSASISAVSTSVSGSAETVIDGGIVKIN